MQRHKLQDMTKGWFIGDFDPTVLETSDFEVAVKYYRAGDSEGLHHHKVATEITVIVEGEVDMGRERFSKGDIIEVEPGEAVSFEAITDVITAVVKVPSVRGDKYQGNHNSTGE